MEKMSFAVIDFETANSRRNSMCEVGVTIVRSGKIEGSFGNLIIPPTGMLSFENTPIHGITPEMVHLQGRWWTEVEPSIREVVGDLPLIAHNVDFDRSVYVETSRAVGMDFWSNYEWIDSVSIARAAIGKGSLAEACAHYQIPLLNHHRAVNDAEATAQLVLAIAREFGIDDVHQLSSLVRTTPQPQDLSSYATPRKLPQSSSPAPSATAATKPKRSGEPMSKEAFLHHTTKRYKKSSDLPLPNADADPNHPIFGQRIAITGDIPGLHDDDVYERIAELGGQPSLTVTNATTILVIAEGAGQGKQDKAREMIEKGLPIEVIQWTEFLSRTRMKERFMWSRDHKD